MDSPGATVTTPGSSSVGQCRLPDSCSWYAFSAEMIGAYDASMKWIRGYGTKLVWNSVMSTFRAPSKRREAVKDDVICAMMRFKLVYVGRSMSRQRRHTS